MPQKYAFVLLPTYYHDFHMGIPAVKKQIPAIWITSLLLQKKKNTKKSFNNLELIKLDVYLSTNSVD
jgi:hypothetical protein